MDAHVKGRTVYLKAAVVRRIREHATLAYPDECCGFLLGRDREDARDIVDVNAVANARSEERTRRYLIDADAVRDAEAAAARGGLDVVGFYHSHPDHPAEPSTFDREHSWPWYTYIIVASHASRTGALRAWQLNDDRAAFHEQPVNIDDTDAAARDAVAATQLEDS